MARRLVPTAVGAIVLALVAAALWWTQRPAQTDTADWPAHAEELVAAALRDLERPGLEIDLLSGGDAPTGAARTSAVARVTWTPGESWPLGTQRSRVRLDLVWTGEEFAVGDVRAIEDPVPLVLLDDVERLDGAEVRAAEATVRAALSGESGELVVVRPDSVASFAALLGQPEDEAPQVAAITTTLGTDGGPIVVLRPDEFAGLDDRGRRIVLVHEAVHALSGVLGAASQGRLTSAPLWVVEGMADLVALADDSAPLSLSAGQVLAATPEALPTDAEFGAGSHAGAAYEGAWLAMRVLDDEFGTAAVERFYRDVLAGASVDAALQRTFGWNAQDLTRAWREVLSEA